MILTPENVTPRCHATVELASLVERPWRYLVTVVGEPPHPYRRVYNVIGPKGADVESAADSCAMKGLELFVKEFGPQLPGVGTVVPRARLV
jgi:hypothetical protein